MKISVLMSEPILTIHPDTSLVEAVNVMEKFHLAVLPVVESDGKFAGLLTERNLILNDSYVHLKTLIKILGGIEYYKKDNSTIKEDLRNLWKLKVADVMLTTPVTLKPDADVEEATRLLGDPMVNSIPIVDEGKLVGMASLSDLTKLYGVSLRHSVSDKNLDQEIQKFMSDFENRFLLVSRFRTQTWFFTSVMFAIVGFVVAFMLILRISVEQ